MTLGVLYLIYGRSSMDECRFWGSKVAGSSPVACKMLCRSTGRTRNFDFRNFGSIPNGATYRRVVQG